MTLWLGPEEGGITQSLISKFVQCPFRTYLYAILGLGDGSPLHPNLIWGDVFHKGLENLIRDKNINQAVSAAHDYLEKKYPEAPSTYLTSIKRLLWKFRLDNYEGDWETEITFEIPVTLPSGRTVLLKGKKDGYLASHPDYGKILGEHKCKKFINPSQLRKELSHDRQLNFYCYLHGIEWVNYDLIKIPEAQKYLPSRNYNETPTEYIDRLFTGPCGSYGGSFPINQNINEWVHQVGPLFFPREEQERYWRQTIYPELERICKFWDWVTQPGFDHENPKFYNDIFYKTPIRQFNGSFTENFECEYYDYLIGDKSIEELPKIPTIFSELEEL